MTSGALGVREFWLLVGNSLRGLRFPHPKRRDRSSTYIPGVIVRTKFRLVRGTLQTGIAPWARRVTCTEVDPQPVRGVGTNQKADWSLAFASRWHLGGTGGRHCQFAGRVYSLAVILTPSAQ